MKKLCAITVFFLLLSFNLYSEEPKNADDQKMQMLKGQIANLQNQEVVVKVLANQYNKELAELRKMEAVFCDIYALDISKWRKGDYTWDNDKGKFILKPKDKNSSTGTEKKYKKK